MNGFRKENPVLFWALALSLIGCAVMVYLGWSLGASVEAKTKVLNRERAILASLQSAPVALTAENVQSAQDFLSEVELKSVQLETGLASKKWAEVPAFSRSEDIYFDLFTMVEDQRDAFEKAGIRISDTEQFGYASVLRDQRVTLPYALDSKEGQAFVGQLHRQKQTLASTLAALAVEEVVELISVERTALDARGDEQVAQADIFAFDETLSVAEAGVIETYPVRLEFRGKTAALRRFILNLNQSPQPLVLRDVAVRPAGSARPQPPSRGNVSNSPFRSLGAPRTAPAADSSTPAGIPIVDSNDSIFTVYLEGYYMVPPSVEGEGV